jgi:hypothetical protein
MGIQFDICEYVYNGEVVRQMHATFISAQGSMDVQVAILRAYAQYMQYDLTVFLSLEQLNKIMILFDFDFRLLGDIEIRKTFYQWFETVDSKLGLELRRLLVEEEENKSDHSRNNKTLTQYRLNCIHRLHIYLNESVRKGVCIIDLLVKMMRDYVHAYGCHGDWLFKPFGLALLARVMLVDAATTTDGLETMSFICDTIYKSVADVSIRHIIDETGAINIKNLFDDSLLDDPAAYKEMENRIRCQDRMQIVSGFVDKFLSSFHELQMNACSGLGLMSSYEEKDLSDAQIGSYGSSNRKPVSPKTIKQD